MTAADHRLDRFRGSLSYEAPGARGIEKAARNPACQRLQALTFAGISPKTAVEKIYGGVSREGQSPFALGAGIRFERVQFDLGAGRVLEIYRSAGRLTMSECKVVDFSLDTIGSRQPDLKRRKAETLRFIKLKLNRDPGAPNLIIKPRLSFSLLDRVHDIEPDCLVASDSDPFYRTVEVKSYPDRGGKSCPADVRSACRQSAVTVVALRQAVSKLGITDPAPLVPCATDLLLRKPGSYRASLRPLNIKGEVRSIEMFLRNAPTLLDAAETKLACISATAVLDNPVALNAVPNGFRGSCREYCALAEYCKQQALMNDDPVLLGDHIKEELRVAGTLSRALDLMYGRGIPPSYPAESALQERLQTAINIFCKVVNDGQ